MAEALCYKDWKVRFAFYGNKNKEALAMASIGWKKRAEL